MGELWKIVLGVIGGIGGIGGIIVLAIKFSANIIAKNLEEKYSAKLSRELESYKVNLQNKNYVTKTRFDKEFEALCTLFEGTCSLISSLGENISYFAMHQKNATSTTLNDLYKKNAKNMEIGNKLLKSIDSMSWLIKPEFISQWEDVYELFGTMETLTEGYIILKQNTSRIPDSGIVLSDIVCGPKSEIEVKSLDHLITIYNETFKKAGSKLNELQDECRKYLDSISIIQ